MIVNNLKLQNGNRDCSSEDNFRTPEKKLSEIFQENEIFDSNRALRSEVENWFEDTKNQI